MPEIDKSTTATATANPSSNTGQSTLGPSHVPLNRDWRLRAKAADNPNTVIISLQRRAGLAKSIFWRLPTSGTRWKETQSIVIDKMRYLDPSGFRGNLNQRPSTLADLDTFDELRSGATSIPKGSGFELHNTEESQKASKSNWGKYGRYAAWTGAALATTWVASELGVLSLAGAIGGKLASGASSCLGSIASAMSSAQSNAGSLASHGYVHGSPSLDTALASATGALARSAWRTANAVGTGGRL
jgi:hypothetical protein